MKYFLTILMLITISFAQAQVKKNDGTPNDITQKEQPSESAIYQLFPTQNMWTFIKLNTRNGQMWQVQYSVNGNRLVSYLNFIPLVTQEKEANGEFTLYPTQNMYNFILLDQLDGRTWQVQWSMDAEKRLILPIE